MRRCPLSTSTSTSRGPHSWRSCRRRASETDSTVRAVTRATGPRHAPRPPTGRAISPHAPMAAAREKRSRYRPSCPRTRKAASSSSHAHRPLGGRTSRRAARAPATDAQSAARPVPCRSAAAAPAHTRVEPCRGIEQDQPAHPFRCLRSNRTGDQPTARVPDDLDRLADATRSQRLEHVRDRRRNVPRWLRAGPSVPPKIQCDHPVIGQRVLGKAPKATAVVARAMQDQDGRSGRRSVCPGMQEHPSRMHGRPGPWQRRPPATVRRSRTGADRRAHWGR
jgi:hypothetical protein